MQILSRQISKKKKPHCSPCSDDFKMLKEIHSFSQCVNQNSWFNKIFVAVVSMSFSDDENHS